MSLPEKPHRKECLNIIDYASHFLKHDDISITDIIVLIETEIGIIRKELYE